MHIVILQPPLVQLNGPYPSGAYLSSFFRSLGPEGIPAPASVRWIDAGNRFFHELFSSAGLARLFSLCRADALIKAAEAEARGDGETAFQLRRYVSLEKAWIGWIDAIVSILCTGDRELCHSFIRSPFVPRGARMDAFLSSLETDPSADDARMFATLAVEDLADFIAVAFDPEFSLVRYAESIASGERHFSNVEAALDRPMVRHFIEPLCDSLWNDITAGIPASLPDGGRILFCLSVPFPGCLVNALAMARSLRRFFGNRAVIAMGGGYVNTELRECENDRLFSYIDLLSFDRGYGGYAWLLKKLAENPGSPGMAIRAGAAPELPRRLFCPPEFAGLEKSLTMTLVPDYSDIDFSRYPRLADEANPMHRLWSDGTWLKAYVAHGCYWHNCSFCDVSLDYIATYLPVGIPKLYGGLRKQALEKHVHGIHLVDEAAPPRALRDFALENLKAAARASTAGANADGANPAGVNATAIGSAEVAGANAAGPGLIPFWGNIRFEKTYTRDLADFLSAGGLSAVSGGIEIASPEGFKSVGKGIDLENLVAVCAAFKEAGVLVHSYLIYGYWDEDVQEIVDSAEVMRQIFTEGLVDSAFWHKFVLTRHSRVCCEWRKGLHRGAGKKSLHPVEAAGDFADNDLRFEGEKEYERFTAPLDAALAAWMTGEGLDRPIRSWFPFPVPAPRIPKNLIAGYIASYERKRDHERNRPCDPAAEYFWVGSEPVLVPALDAAEAGNAGLAGKDAPKDLLWFHLGDAVRLPVDGDLAGSIVAALAGKPGGLAADTDALAKLPRAVFKALRHHGLCRISPL